MQKRARLILVIAAVAAVAAAIPLIAATGAPARAGAGGGTGEPGKVAAELRKVIERNARAYNDENLGLMVSTVHPEAVLFEQTRDLMRHMVAAYDLKYDILSFGYIGRDKDFAVVRVKQRTRKIRGPHFRDNELDAMHVLRLHGKEWKLWQTAMLNVKFLDGARAAPK